MAARKTIRTLLQRQITEPVRWEETDAPFAGGRLRLFLRDWARACIGGFTQTDTAESGVLQRQCLTSWKQKRRRNARRFHFRFVGAPTRRVGLSIFPISLYLFNLRPLHRARRQRDARLGRDAEVLVSRDPKGSARPRASLQVAANQNQDALPGARALW